jgi:hypothetical protein
VEMIVEEGCLKTVIRLTILRCFINYHSFIDFRLRQRLSSIPFQFMDNVQIVKYRSLNVSLTSNFTMYP